ETFFSEQEAERWVEGLVVNPWPNDTSDTFAVLDTQSGVEVSPIFYSERDAEEWLRELSIEPRSAVRKRAKNPQSGHGESELETPEHPNEHDPSPMWPWEIDEVEEIRDIVGEGSKTAAATTDDFMRMARDKFAWPGGYEMFFITDDGGTLCY